MLSWAAYNNSSFTCDRRPLYSVWLCIVYLTLIKILRVSDNAAATVAVVVFYLSENVTGGISLKNSRWQIGTGRCRRRCRERLLLTDLLDAPPVQTLLQVLRQYLLRNPILPHQVGTYTNRQEFQKRERFAAADTVIASWGLSERDKYIM